MNRFPPRDRPPPSNRRSLRAVVGNGVSSPVIVDTSMQPEFSGVRRLRTRRRIRMPWLLFAGLLVLGVLVAMVQGMRAAARAPSMPADFPAAE